MENAKLHIDVVTSAVRYTFRRIFISTNEKFIITNLSLLIRSKLLGLHPHALILVSSIDPFGMVLIKSHRTNLY
jgi:hypothetical protein